MLDKRIGDALALLPHVDGARRDDLCAVLKRFMRPPFFDHQIILPAHTGPWLHQSGMIVPEACHGILDGMAWDSGLTSGFELVLSFDDAGDAQVALDTINAAEPAPSNPPPAPPPEFGGTVPRLTVYQRNDVAWLSARSWRNATKKSDIAALKLAKACNDAGVIDIASGELSTLLGRFAGHGGGLCVTSVPCGHSRRPDCFGWQLATATADRMQLPYRKLFADRFCTGVSHPKEFAKLPALELVEVPPTGMVLVIDDVATSGWHMEEVLSCLRQQGCAAMGAVWISGSVD